jgi:hypothetical protein
MSGIYFDWNQDFKDINRIFIRKFGAPSIKTLREYSDTKLDWFQKIFPQTFTSEEACLDSIIHCLKSQYDGIRLYHCCRPLKVTSYYNKGLMLLEKDFIRAHLLSIYREITDTSYNEILLAIEAAFKFTGKDGFERRKYPYLFIDKSMAFSTRNNNFFRNPEILDIITNEISTEELKTNLYEKHHRASIPTVLVVDVPFEILGARNIKIISSLVAWKWAGIYFDKPEGECFKLDFGLAIPTAINKMHIKTHKHPRDTKDFDAGNSIYCDKCKKKIHR